MMCLFYIYDVYDRHNYLSNFTQKLRPFLDIYLCMDIMMRIVKEDILIAYFGSTWSRAMNRKADTSAERGCQSKM